MTEDQMITFQLEVVADEDYPADPATLGEVARYVSGELKKMGYSVTSIYTGERGGEFLEFVKNVLVTVVEHRAVIMEVIQDAGTILGVIGAAQKLVAAKHKEPIEIKVEVINEDGSALKSPGADDESKQDVQKKLPAFIEQSPKTKKRKFKASVRQPSRRRRR